MLRICHVGLGPLGLRIQRDLAARGAGRTLAAIDVDPALAGRPLAEFVPGAGSDVRIAPSLDGLPPAIDAALVTTSSSLASCADTFRELLARGLAVVSTCEELAWPWHAHAALAQELDDLARARGGRLLGTGVNPGYLMDALPLFASGVCQRVDSISAWRIQDASPRRVPFQRKIGATLTVAEFEARVADGTLRHVGLGESLHFLAHFLGLEFDRWSETLEPVLAPRDLACDLGSIPRGRVAGVRQVARALSGERTVVHLEFQAAIAQPDPVDRVRIEGEPAIELAIAGGVHGDTATSAIAINALRPLLAAPPGLHTMASVPMVFCTPRG